MLMTMWPVRMYSMRLCVPSSVMAQSTTATMMMPGITSFAGPMLVVQRPTRWPSRPITSPPGSSSKPVCSVVEPSTFCR